MMNCWEESPTDRPTMETALQKIQSYLDGAKPSEGDLGQNAIGSVAPTAKGEDSLDD